MKFSINSSQFVKALKRANKVVSSKQIVPILDMVMLTLAGKELVLVTSDLNRNLETKLQLEFEPEEQGATCVDIRKLIEYLGTISDQSISLETTPTSLVLTHASGKAKFPSESAKDFPKPHKVGEVEQYTFEMDTILPLLTSLADLANQEVGPISGVYVSGNELVSSDGHSIHRCLIDHQVSGHCIIPKKAIAALLQTLENDETFELKVGINSRFSIFETDRIKLTTQNVDEKFVAYGPLLAVKQPDSISCNRKELIDKIRRVEILSHKSERIVGIEITDEGMTIWGDDSQKETEAREQMPCMTFLEPGFRFGFSSTRMLRHLNYFDTEEVTIQLGNNLQPFTIEEGNRISVIAPANLEARQ